MNLTTFRSRLSDDRGSAVSVIILFLTAFMFVELMVLGGRVAGAKADVAAAAREGARAGSLVLSPGQANSAGQVRATTFLVNRGHQCRGVGVGSGDTSNFRAGGEYSFTATCVVDLSDLGVLLPIPLVLTAEYTATEHIEKHRVIGP